MQQIRRRLGILAKSAVSVTLIVYLFSKVGWQNVWDVMRQANPYLLVAYLFLGTVSIFVSAVKWHVLCRAVGIQASLLRLFLLYLVGCFFNHILPTSVGGDVVRAYELGRTDGRLSRPMAAIFVERFTGITTLLLLALLALCLDARFAADGRIVLLLVLAWGGYLAGTVLILNRTLSRHVESLGGGSLLGKWTRKVRNVQDAIHVYRQHRPALVGAMIISVIFYGTAVLNSYVGCLMLGVHVPLVSVMAAVPIMMVLFMIPISLGGIGLQEWAFTVVLGMVGVPPAVGLSLGLVFRARNLALGLLGGAFYPMVSENPTAAGRNPLGVEPDHEGLTSAFCSEPTRPAS